MKELLAKYRVAARIVAVLLGYIAYRLPGDDALDAGIPIGAGTIMLLWSAVDAAVGSSDEQGSSRIAVQSLAGVALIGVGVAMW